MVNMGNLVDWSDLPTDVLILILGRLQIKDYFRAGVVCVSWNSIVDAKPISCAPSLPWLMVDPISKGFSTTRAMFDPFSQKEECRVLLQSPWSIGSTSCDYLMHLDDKKELLVMNPLTGSRLLLPSTTTLNPKFDEQSKIKYVALLDRPTTVVAIAYLNVKERRQYIAFSSPGDKRWTFLDVSSCVRSMIFHQGLLYVLSRYSGTTIWDFRGEHPPRLMSTLEHSNPGPNFHMEYMFLVESSTGDNLLQVQASMYGKHAIFKVGEDPGRWCRVGSLCGEDALMLSPNRAVCFSATDFHMLQGNCIYSIIIQWDSLYATGNKRKFSESERPMRVFNLGQGSMEFLKLDIKQGLQLDWFTPCIW